MPSSALPHLTFISSCMIRNNPQPAPRLPAGIFNFISQMLDFPSFSSFTPRFSIAGKLSGNGL